MTSQKPISVAIVGGGIGGLCLAIGLLRFAHINVAVYEAAPEFKEISAGLALGPNAQRALQMISPEAARGFRDIATSNSSPEFQNTWFEFRNGIRGPQEGVLLSKCQNETGQQNVYRAKFLNVIARLVPPSVAHFGKRLIAIEDRGNGVQIQFADGTTAEADCAIGADGVHSRIRKHLLGAEDPAASPVFSGIVSYRGLIPMEAAREKIGKFSEDAYMWCGDGGMVMTYPINSGETLNVVASMSGKSSWDEDRYVVSASKSSLMKDFEGWCGIPTKVLEMIENPTLWAMLHHLPATCYNAGNIAIMGDAAHATTPFQGQGAGQAIEDALVLTRLFGHVTSPERIPLALSAYDRVRRIRSQDVVTTSKEAMDLYAFKDGYVNGDPVRWKKVWNERMRWIWEINLNQHCNEAVKIFMRSI